MTSTFQGIEIGKRAVVAHQQAIATTGHNLSNMNTEGYSRQRVEFVPFEPIYMPGLEREETPGQVGQGTAIERIERIRDLLLDEQIVVQASKKGYWDARDPVIRLLEQVYQEVGDSSVRGGLDQFWDAWEELANSPADTAPRTAVVERGKTLMDSINVRFQRLKGYQDMVERDIRATVNRVNDLSLEIADLNNQIQKIKAMNDQPNDLMDRRDLLVDKLSALIDVTVDRRDPDEFMVHTSGMILVQGGIGRQFTLEKRPGEDGYSQIHWAETGQEIRFWDRTNGYQGHGSLGALTELRDVTIEDEIRSLDTFAMNFIDLVNEVHRDGYGINGVTGMDFFVERPYVPNVNGNYDRSGDGEFDSSYIFRINGANALEPNAQPGLEGVVTLSGYAGNVEVPYYITDTVSDIVGRINNSGAEVVVRLNRDGQLQLKGTPAEGWENPDFVIRHVEDSGFFLEGYAGLLAGRGPEGAYDWDGPNAVTALQGGTESYAVAPIAHPSGWIEVNPALFRDVGSVASGFGMNGRAANPGNGQAAMAISSIRYSNVMIGRQKTFEEYFADAVGRIGELGKQSGELKESHSQKMKDLMDLRQSVAGVSMDEELSALIKYQHGYNAAARFITVVNSMLDTLINRMGV
ncbi:MAG: flagellar hook-associated protein FlgK [Treponema sp.]|jgi:flagellar hook-associated protein 1 FlgK|nr:flagellar hook-associated protein FlgK [Treponema sp.]